MHIFIKSEQGEGLTMMVVDIQYAQMELDTSHLYWEGLDWGGRDHRLPSLESQTKCFIFQV